ncbi:NADH dehydrogenase [Phycicoccus badiiscoriae]|uniref:NADH dehydrogenase n=1 Tax=Pedococcus badiiscoriae TaxID=642776 RepID=A0A852WHH8_9MICO|nr:NAD(P)H-binding protein [Pedococcus badiiscoriae]NYG08693.1 NADH dehydrogenase [Pedococcus badiiscoriae]
MILVAGGTGRLGSLVRSQLSGSGHPVRVLSRHGTGSGTGTGTDTVIGDVRDPQSLQRAFDGVRTVVSAVTGMAGTDGSSPGSVDRDGNANLVEAARNSGATVVLVSIVGVRADHPMELFRAKWAAEQNLLASGVPWTIVRATAFAETWRDVLAEVGGHSGRDRVLGRGQNPVNFVCVADVASAVVRAAVDPTLRGHVVEVAGPENLSLLELSRRLGQAIQPPAHVPRAALRAMAFLARPVSPTRARLARAALVMDTADMRADPAPGHAAYPWLPETRVGGQSVQS